MDVKADGVAGYRLQVAGFMGQPQEASSFPIETLEKILLPKAESLTCLFDISN